MLDNKHFYSWKAAFKNFTDAGIELNAALNILIKYHMCNCENGFFLICHLSPKTSANESQVGSKIWKEQLSCRMLSLSPKIIRNFLALYN